MGDEPQVLGVEGKQVSLRYREHEDYPTRVAIGECYLKA